MHSTVIRNIQAGYGSQLILKRAPKTTTCISNPLIVYFQNASSKYPSSLASVSSGCANAIERSTHFFILIFAAANIC